MNLQIAPTRLEDLNQACHLFDDAIAYQQRKGYPVYRTNDRTGVEQSIRDGLLYKWRQVGQAGGDVEIAAVF